MGSIKDLSHTQIMTVFLLNHPARKAYGDNGNKAPHIFNLGTDKRWVSLKLRELHAAGTRYIGQLVAAAAHSGLCHCEALPGDPLCVGFIRQTGELHAPSVVLPGTWWLPGQTDPGRLAAASLKGT
jgi:hypothetical protein